MIIQPLTLPAALYVAANMRDADCREIFATRPDEDRERLAADAAGSQYAWCAGEGEPIACIGASFRWPGVYQVWMFATDAFSAVGFPLTRWVRRIMIPALERAGAHWAHCYSIEGHDQAHRWLEEGLGAMHEFTYPKYGKRQEPFRLYSWYAQGTV